LLVLPVILILSQNSEEVEAVLTADMNRLTEELVAAKKTGTHGLPLSLSTAHDRTISQAKSSAQVGASLPSNLVILTREQGLLKARHTL
jgi:hypothetical protein